MGVAKMPRHFGEGSSVAGRGAPGTDLPIRRGSGVNSDPRILTMLLLERSPAAAPARGWIGLTRPEAGAGPRRVHPPFRRHSSVLVRASRLGELSLPELQESPGPWLARASRHRVEQWLSNHPAGGRPSAG
jgi:hypothetical protein